MFKAFIAASAMLWLLAAPAMAKVELTEPRHTGTIAKPKAPAGQTSTLPGRDPSVCGDAEAVARIEAESGSTARAFDKYARGTEEGKLGRTLETSGATYTTSVCRDDPTSVLIFIYSSALAKTSGQTPRSAPLQGGASHDEAAPATGGANPAPVPGSYFQGGVVMRDTFDTVIAGCGIVYQQQGDFRSRKTCLSAANVEGCQRFRVNNPACVAIIAQGTKVETQELVARPGQLMSDCTPGTAPLGGTSGRACAGDAGLKSRMPQMDDTPSPVKPGYDPSKPIPGSIRETGPIVIAGKTYTYGRGEPYYNGMVRIEGWPDAIPFTIDVSREEGGLNTVRHMTARFGKLKYVEGTIAPIADSAGNLTGLDFTVTRVGRDGKGIKPVVSKPAHLEPSGRRLVTPEFRIY